jgi:hypothetical protein
MAFHIQLYIDTYGISYWRNVGVYLLRCLQTSNMSWGIILIAVITFAIKTTALDDFAVYDKQSHVKLTFIFFNVYKRDTNHYDKSLFFHYWLVSLYLYQKKKLTYTEIYIFLPDCRLLCILFVFKAIDLLIID